MPTKQKYVETPLGWRRYFWGSKPSPTEILGTKVQGTAADLCKYVANDVVKNLPPQARMVSPEWLTTTHDSLLIQVLKEAAGQYSTWLRAKMEQPIPWLDRRQWRADVKVGPDWRSVS
mgnify:CR=1 FL=1